MDNLKQHLTRTFRKAGAVAGLAAFLPLSATWLLAVSELE